MEWRKDIDPNQNALWLTTLPGEIDVATTKLKRGGWVAVWSRSPKMGEGPTREAAVEDLIDRQKRYGSRQGGKQRHGEV